jgi:hypothetical protein
MQETEIINDHDEIEKGQNFNHAFIVFLPIQNQYKKTTKRNQK